MSLLSQTCKFIEKEMLFTPEDRLLLAVSGGKDSMVMMDALYVAGYDISIAHINYRLRGAEADADANLVQRTAAGLGIDVHTYVVSDIELQSLQDGNLQEQARDIRYRYFQHICHEHHYQYICTAHHAQDRAETFFLHLMRGSGLTGLSAMRSVADKIRRPLLTATTAAISAYANEHHVNYRHDASNTIDKYDRNYVRHHILPALTERWPHATTSINQAMDQLNDTNALLLAAIHELSLKWKVPTDDGIKIGPLSAMRLYPGARTLMHHMLRPYEVPSDDIYRIINEQVSTGAHINSRSDYNIIIDRDELIIQSKVPSVETEEIMIDRHGHFKNQNNIQLSLESVDKPTFNTNSQEEIIDLHKVTYPLTWRRWQQGDRMYPIGMKGKSKLISDILIDNKMDVLSKRRVEVLINGDREIIWLIGIRISDRYKVTAATNAFLKLKITDNLTSPESAIFHAD